eukprot:458832_1
MGGFHSFNASCDAIEIHADASFFEWQAGVDFHINVTGRWELSNITVKDNVPEIINVYNKSNNFLILEGEHVMYWLIFGNADVSGCELGFSDPTCLGHAPVEDIGCHGKPNILDCSTSHISISCVTAAPTVLPVGEPLTNDEPTSESTKDDETLSNKIILGGAAFVFILLLIVFM